MMQRFKVVAAFLLGAGVTLTGSAVAGGPGGMHGAPFLGVMRDLDLTAEQKALADELLQAAKAEREAGRAAREAHLETVTTELAKPSPNSAALHGLIDDATTRWAAAAHDRLDDFLSLHATLTDAQRQTLVAGITEASDGHHERMDSMRERFEGARERRGHDRRGGDVAPER